MTIPPQARADADAAPGADAALVAEALDVPLARMRLLSREPLADGSVAGYAVTDRAGSSTIAYLDTSRLPVAAETGVARSDGVRVWVHPADPHLPALAPVAFAGGADALLARLGLGPLGGMELVAYRPGRRAVLRADVEGRVVWIKVTRPTRTSRIVAAHRALRDAGLPIPDVLGWSPDGVIVTAGAAGRPATDATWHPSSLLDAVDALRTRLAPVALDQPARVSLAARLPWYVDRLDAVRPADRRPGIVAGAVSEALTQEPPRLTTVHGDLHIGQLFVDAESGTRVTGVIDVDTAGRGDPDEDAAAFIAHALASAVATEEHGGPGADRLRALAAVAAQRWGSPRLAALTPVHLLGHALGAAERGEDAPADRLLAAAERMARGAADAGKNGLIVALDPP